MDGRSSKKDKRKNKSKSHNEIPPPRGSSPPPSLRPYTIPKTGSKKLFASISLDSREGKEITKNINNSLWDANAITMDITKLELVQNTALQAEYSTKRKEMKEQNRSTAETTDSYGFLIFRNIAECKKACSTGIERKTQYLPSGATCCIGDSKYGVYLCRCADILKKTPIWNSSNNTVLLICKFMKGRLKSVVEQVSHGASSFEPTPDFDGHTSKNFQRGKKWNHDKIYNTSQIYLYEINLDNFSEDDDSAIFSKRPRQCLPYAIATFRAKQKTQQQAISKPLAAVQKNNPTALLLSIPPRVLIERGLDTVNTPELDFETLSQHHVKFIWNGTYYNNETPLADIQAGTYSTQNIVFPIEGPILCITQKISINRLSKLLPQKIFRKPPVCSGVSIVSAENVKFLHAEIHPVTITSAKIDKLHNHWLKNKMAGVCTISSGLKLFIIPTGSFTDKLGITCRGYPPVLHLIFMRQFLDSAIVLDKEKIEYAKYLKPVNRHLQDRLGHNEELKNQNQNPTISAKKHGHSGPERLIVLSSLSKVRKAFEGTRNRSRNEHDIPTKQSTSSAGTSSSDIASLILESRLSKNKDKDANSKQVDNTSIDTVQPATPDTLHPTTPKIVQQISQPDIVPITTDENQFQLDQLRLELDSPAVQLLKQTNPEWFEKITGQKVTNVIPSENQEVSLETTTVTNNTELLDASDNLWNSTALTPEDMDIESEVEKAPPVSAGPENKSESVSVSKANLCHRLIQQTLYNRSIFGSLHSMLHLSKETSEKEKEMQKLEEDRRGYGNKKIRDRDGYTSRSARNDRSRDERYKGSLDRSKNREIFHDRDRSRDRQKNRKDSTRNDCSKPSEKIDQTAVEKVHTKMKNLENIFIEKYQLYDESTDETPDDSSEKTTSGVQPASTINEIQLSSKSVVVETNNSGPTFDEPKDKENDHSDIPFLEHSQDESDEEENGNLVIDTDTQPSSASHLLSDETSQSELKITNNRKEINEVRASETLREISKAFYDECFEKTLSPSSNTSTFSPTDALDALKGEMRKQASEVRENHVFGKGASYQDISSESDFGNIEATIMNGRNRRNSEGRPVDVQRDEVKRDVTTNNTTESLNHPAKPTTASQDSEFVETRSSHSSISGSPMKTTSSKQDKTERKSRSHSRSLHNKHRSHSKGRRSRSKDRHRSRSRSRRRYRSRSRDRSRDGHANRHRSRSPPKRKHDLSQDNKRKGDGHSNSPLFTPSHFIPVNSGPINENVDEPKDSHPDNGQVLSNSQIPTEPSKNPKYRKTSPNGSKSTGYEIRSLDLPRVSSWKEAAMRRTEEKRRIYPSSSDEEGKEKIRKTTTQRKSSSGSKKTEKADLKPNLSDLTDEEEEKLADTKQIFLRLARDETSVEPIVDFRSIIVQPEPLLPKQKIKRTKCNKENNLFTQTAKPSNEHYVKTPVTDRSVTPPLEVLMFKETKSMGTQIQKPPLPGVSSLPVLSYHVTCREGFFPQVVTQSAFNSYGGIPTTSSVQEMSNPGSSRELNSSFILTNPITSSSSIQRTGNAPEIDQGMNTMFSPISSVSGSSPKRPRSLKEWNAELPRTELDEFCESLIHKVTGALE